MEEEKELRKYRVTFELGPQSIVVDAEDREHAVARATDQLLAQAYRFVGTAPVTAERTYEPDIAL